MERVGLCVDAGGADNPAPSNDFSTSLARAAVMSHVASQLQPQDGPSERKLLYREFEDAKVWEVFTSPKSKVTKEDAKSRARLASSKSKKLSEDEVKERESWGNSRKYWEDHTESRLKVPSIGEFLSHHVLPPLLQHLPNIVSRSSSRKEKRKRMFPPRGKVRAWVQFDESVSSFEPESIPNSVLDDPWIASVLANGPLENEGEEKTWLKTNVLNRLKRARLLEIIRASATPLGIPDLCLYAGNGEEQRVVACVEAKSTHNLWLPSNANDVVTNYDECWMDSDLNHCIAHPIGQVARTMIVNGASHGAITSATRTYFVRFVVADDELHLLLSRRWYVGERNYLRAWAFFYNAAVREVGLKLCKDLFCSWKHLSPRKDGDYIHSRRQSAEVYSLRIEYDDIRFTGGTFGDGRNGFVREAVWRDKTVAVKSFDMDHGSCDSFDRELESYMKLVDAQGVLIPKLYFWADHWTGSLSVLGLQLGTYLPFSSDREHSVEKEAVLENLYNLGYTHEDSDDFRNFTYIPDGNGGHRMVVLDLESLEPCQPSSPITQSSDHDDM